MKILRDTREKKGWDWTFGYENVEIVDQGIPTGDYTIEGYEELICVERKSSTSELALNLGKHRKRFENELERLTSFRFRWVLCEFSKSELLDFPKGANIPPFLKKKVRVRGPYLMSLVVGLSEQYETEFIFYSDREQAEQAAYNLMMEAVRVIDSER
jgi:hypothetical protein